MKLPSLRDKRDSSARFSDMIKQIRMDLMRKEKLQPSNCLATSFDQHQYLYIYISWSSEKDLEYYSYTGWITTTLLTGKN